MGWAALENREAMQQKYRIAEIRPGQVHQESKRTSINNISLLIVSISNTADCHHVHWEWGYECIVCIMLPAQKSLRFPFTCFCFRCLSPDSAQPKESLPPPWQATVQAIWSSHCTSAGCAPCKAYTFISRPAESQARPRVPPCTKFLARFKSLLCNRH